MHTKYTYTCLDHRDLILHLTEADTIKYILPC